MLQDPWLPGIDSQQSLVQCTPSLEMLTSAGIGLLSSASGGRQPEILLPPTGSIDVARRRLEDVKTGGRTPLPEGLKLAADLIEREHRREPGRRAILVILSDGKATGANGLTNLRMVAHDIAQRGLAGSVVIDCENQSRIRLGLALELAKNLGAPCISMTELNAESVTGVINAI